MDIPFSKLHGCQNSFVIVRDEDIADYNLWDSAHREGLARWVCDPGSGLGADGFFVVGRGSRGLVVEMRNPDGGLMGMCGNGVRCVVHAAHRWGWGGLEGTIEVRIGSHTVICHAVDAADHDGQMVRVAMGAPRFEPTALPLRVDAPLRGAELVLGGRRRVVWAVSMGNPHCVLEDRGDDLREVGPAIEHDPLFPERTNVELVTVVSPRAIRVRVWERGAGITKACGTGACASAVVCIEQGRCDSPVTVSMPGGDLTVEWNRSDNQVYLTGPSQEIASGTLRVPAYVGQPLPHQ